MKKHKQHLHSIAIVICHSGPLPWYFDYFVHSCGFNPTVDFYILSDDASYTKATPPNVIIKYNTLKDFSDLATEKIGFKVKVESGYKLCDFKPAYGFIFGDLLEDYDFWGHGDIDIILGDVRGFITEDILANNDLIVVRHDVLTGYFQLFRNNDKLNTLFMKSKDYQHVFRDARHFCFDETNFQFDPFKEGKKYNEIPSEIESMMHVVKRMEEENYIRAHFDFMVLEGLPGRMKWTNGNLYYRNKFEILLYHMIYFKKKFTPKARPKHIPNIFRISKERIYH